MANSLKFTALERRIQELEDNLLPAINPTATYSVSDQDLVRSYCLLCHAEIEAYIEGITDETITKAFTKWEADRQNISPIIFHLAYSYKAEKKEPVYSMISIAYNQLKKVIEKNHGIKEDNLNNFFKPIGFQMDNVLTTTLNDFGKTRGQIAHTSFHTQQPLDPSIKRNSIKSIMQGLKLFDTELINYESLGDLPRTAIIIPWKKMSFIERCIFVFTGNYKIQ